MPEPDGPQFSNLWNEAMDEAFATLDAIPDEDLADAVAEARISDAIRGMTSASQIEETGHSQDAPPRVDSAGRAHLTPEEHERWFRIHTPFDEDEGPVDEDEGPEE
tara:strand:- start:432 stop:749 length:318 start_codon:yes stop_codon:yes gene_type:complete